MKHTDLENPLRETLHDCAKGIHAEDGLKMRIDALVDAPRVQRHTHRRFAIGVAAAVCLTLVGALARGPVTGLVSSMGRDTMRTTVSALQKDAEKVLDGVVVPEQLGGYAFEEGGVEYTDKVDDSGNRFGRFPDVSASYRKGSSGLHFTVHAWDEEVDGMDAKQPDEIRQLADVDVSYRVDDYIFLPVGEQPTADEQARMENGELYISYGTDARESAVFQHATFRAGELAYNVYTSDASVTADMLFDAAAQVLETIK